MNPQELLPDVILGIATPEEAGVVQAALEQDPALRAEYAAFERSLAALGALSISLPPPKLKSRVLEAARASALKSAQPKHTAPQAKHIVPRRSWRGLPWLLGAAATALTAVTVLFFGVFQVPVVNATTVATLPDGGVVYGNSGSMSRTTPIVLVRASGEKIPVKFSADKECEFRAATSSDGLVYLLDSANNTVFIVEAKTGQLVDRWVVPPNATAMDVVGDTVVVRSSSVAIIFRRNQSKEKSMVEARLERQGTQSPEAAVLDGDLLYATDQKNGLIQVLSALDGTKMSQFEAPDKPVSLAVRDGLWVLDAAGVLYKLELPTGKVILQVALQGTPQRLRLTDQYAFIADAEGYISVIDLETKQVSARKRFQNPAMALSAMPDGHVALALKKRGVVVVDNKLEIQKTIY
ncbi:MAG: hypothetical protein ACK41E_01410 [Deinococcales bacterium]